MKKMVRILGLILTFVLVVSTVLTGCGQTKEAEGSTAQSTIQATSVQAEKAEQTVTEDKIDTSKEVKIKGYLLGQAPAGLPDVLTEFNSRLKDEINATMEINYIGWGDFKTKYPLILASGEEFDWILVGGWDGGYVEQAQKGAYMEISEEMINKYMPKYSKAISPDAFKTTRVNGKLYMLPSSTPDISCYGMLIRGDLRKKYGIPEIKKVSDLEPYFEAIKKNEPGMFPYNMSKNETWVLYNCYLVENGGFVKTLGGVGTWVYDWDGPSGTFIGKFAEPHIAVYKKMAEWIRGLYVKGYIPKNPFQNEIQSQDSLIQGKSASAQANITGYIQTLNKAKDIKMELEYIPVLSLKGGTVDASSYLDGGVALCKNTKNAERAMMVLDLIMEDPIYANLVYYGIEGKHYIKDQNGKVALPEGMKSDENPYAPDAAGFWFSNDNILMPQAIWSDEYIAFRKYMMSRNKLAFYQDFRPNTESIKTENANISQVVSQYENPIKAGMVEDIDAAIAVLQEKLKAAGVDKVNAEVKAQAEAYAAANK